VVKNELSLDHDTGDAWFLDRNSANQTLPYFAELWQHRVHLKPGY
jgi:spore cortex formation protein SpoVR/YcgB (stage V sporulation)